MEKIFSATSRDSGDLQKVEVTGFADGRAGLYGRRRGRGQKKRGDRLVTPSFDEPDRDRTCDPLIKSQLLYQLSYRPA